MRIIDVNPEHLRARAEDCRHAFDQAIIHIDAEFKGVIPELMETLTREGPYGYTIMPHILPDGQVKLPVLSTRDEIHGAYTYVRGASDLLSVIGLTEVRGEWYLFQDNISQARVKETGDINDVQMLGLFPSGTGDGITGELIWVRLPQSSLGRPDQAAEPITDEIQARHRVFEGFERYLEALRGGDVDGVLNGLNDGVASAVRDYVTESGALASLEGKDAHRVYFEKLFAKFRFDRVEPLIRVTESWFVFAELRLEGAHRDGDRKGEPVSFNTAEFFVPGNDGRFIARIGHGTDPASA